MQKQKARETLSQMPKRTLCIILVVVLVCSCFLGYIIPAQAATYEKLTVSKIGTIKASEIGVDKSFYYLALDNKQVFCLSPGGHAGTGDEYKVENVNPMTYTFNNSTELGRKIARAMVYWNTQSYFETNHKAMQTYIWSVVKGKDAAVAVQQATGWTATTSRSYVSAIESTAISGTLKVCTVHSCPHGKSSKNQILLRWSPEAYAEPEYGYETATVQKTDSVNQVLTIAKKDFETGEFVDTAKFSIYRDGKILTKSDVSELISGSYHDTKFSTKDAKVTIEYEKTYTTGKLTSKKIYYVKNWSELSEVQQKTALKNGYHSNQANAQAEAQAEANAMAEARMTALKSELHTWEIVETEAPSGYSIATDPTQTFTENASSSTSKTIVFENAPQRGYIEIYKRNGLNTSLYSFETKGAEALNRNKTSNFSGAVYQILAAEDITDNQGNVTYKTGDVVEEVTLNTITKDGETVGYGKTDVLYPGSYQIKEMEAPKGFEINPKTYHATIAISPNETEVIEVVNTLDYETYGFAATKITRDYNIEDVDGRPVLKVEEALETEAAFDLYFLDGDEYVKLKTYNTDTNGMIYQEEGLIPGKYKLVQTAGKEGFDFIKPLEFTIVFGKEMVNLGTLVDTNIPSEYGFIEVYKEYVLVDPENPDIIIDYGKEMDATFEILNSEGEVVDTIITDKNGYGVSIPLSEEGVYTIRQVSGKEGYNFSADENIDVKLGEIMQANGNSGQPLKNTSNATKIKIQKSTTDTNGKSNAQAEANAEFYVIDMDMAKAANIALDTVPTSTLERTQLINTLKKADAIIGSMITDSTGICSLVVDGELDNYCIMQTRGTAGYDMISTFLTKNNATIYDYGENGQVHSFVLKNPKTDYGYGYLAINKVMTRTNTEAVAEEGAVFQILDNSSKEVLQTLITDENGYVISERLEAGKYILHQVSGADEYHQLIKDSVFTITETDKGTIYYPVSENYLIKSNTSGVKYTEKTLKAGSTYLDIAYTTTKSYVLNPEELVKLKLTKYDAENKNHLLKGASYAFYDETGNEILDEQGNGISLITDENGEAQIYLDYGTYYIGEKLAPEGYTRNTAIMKLEVTSDGITLSIQEEGTSEMVYEGKTYHMEGLTATYTAEELEAMQKDCQTLQLAVQEIKTVREEAYTTFLTLYEKDTSENIATLSEAYTLAAETYYEAVRAKTVADSDYNKALGLTDVTEEELQNLKTMQTEANTALTNATAAKNTAYTNLKNANNELAVAQANYQEKNNDYMVSQINYANAINQYQAATKSSSYILCYNLSDKDNPIYASLTVQKTGNVLSDAVNENGDTYFEYEQISLKGASFALYAAEDIKSYDGLLYHTKGSLIASGTTDENGKLLFKRNNNGTMTEKLHLGSYYYIETSAPYGYVADTTKKYIELTDSTLAEELGALDIGKGINETFEITNKGTVMKKYSLGTNLTATLYTTGVLEICGEGTAPKYTSASSVPWYKDGNYLKIQSVVAGLNVSFSSLDYYFYGCNSLVAFEVEDENAFTNLTSMKKAFSGCHALTIVPSFANSTKLTDISYAFENCYVLSTTPDFTDCTAIASTAYAFSQCYQLKYKATLPTVESTTYKNCVNLVN